MFEIEVFSKKGFKNSRGEHVASDILGMGIKDVSKVEYSPLYFIGSDISFVEAKLIASELLSDKITEGYIIRSNSELDSMFIINFDLSVIEVLYKKGVTDTVSESIVKAIKDLGIVKEVKVKTGHKYYMHGKVSQAILEKIATKLLVNTLVQDYKIKNIK